MRTFADWNDPLPGSIGSGSGGFIRGDTVGGHFVYTLTLTDIADPLDGVRTAGCAREHVGHRSNRSVTATDAVSVARAGHQ